MKGSAHCTDWVPQTSDLIRTIARCWACGHRSRWELAPNEALTPHASPAQIEPGRRPSPFLLLLIVGPVTRRVQGQGMRDPGRRGHRRDAHHAIRVGAHERADSRTGEGGAQGLPCVSPHRCVCLLLAPVGSRVPPFSSPHALQHPSCSPREHDLCRGGGGGPEHLCRSVLFKPGLRGWKIVVGSLALARVNAQLLCLSALEGCTMRIQQPRRRP